MVEITCPKCGHNFNRGYWWFTPIVTCSVCDYTIGELKVVFEPYLVPT